MSLNSLQIASGALCNKASDCGCSFNDAVCAKSNADKLNPVDDLMELGVGSGLSFEGKSGLTTECCSNADCYQCFVDKVKLRNLGGK